MDDNKPPFETVVRAQLTADQQELLTKRAECAAAKRRLAKLRTDRKLGLDPPVSEFDDAKAALALVEAQLRDLESDIEELRERAVVEQFYELDFNRRWANARTAWAQANFTKAIKERDDAYENYFQKEEARKQAAILKGDRENKSGWNMDQYNKFATANRDALLAAGAVPSADVPRIPEEEVQVNV